MVMASSQSSERTQPYRARLRQRCFQRHRQNVGYLGGVALVARLGEYKGGGSTCGKSSGRMPGLNAFGNCWIDATRPSEQCKGRPYRCCIGGNGLSKDLDVPKIDLLRTLAKRAAVVPRIPR